jgi:replication-associated recombination protein RarA
MNIRNAPTKLMKSLGYGEGYEKYTNEDLMLEKLKGKTYFKKPKGKPSVEWLDKNKKYFSLCHEWSPVSSSLARGAHLNWHTFYSYDYE